ncbi:hypothetical protein BDZ90DRAFT_257827 [Jaminaea rosea]|uniref:Uncharacterized protein n=1 Tax=Jaminaea rosea TaxID=1569628 RepID=A0A316V186_9BASI|nr:hypothetical protein BDZ90DRAFT_257827 [Jaminaea rosea]PWN30768.1 hypothetical protein BDZ90DRAFT_257827 [Jaminaea rosea]
MAASGPVMPTSATSRSSKAAAGGHGNGIGSTSGAGLWLASGDPTAGQPLAKAEQTKSATSGSTSTTSPPRRTYHIQADAATVSAHASGLGAAEWDLLSRGLGRMASSNDASSSKDSDPVDLDLSFDFVSQLESSRRYRPDIGSSSSSSLTAQPTSSARPRGMSDSISASRRKPPKPLSLLKKASQATFKTLSSNGDDEDGELASSSTLPIEPLSASRRGIDSALSPPATANTFGRPRSRTLSNTLPPASQPPTTPLPPIPSPTTVDSPSSTSLDLVKQQRNKRAEEQLRERMQRDSYMRQPISPSAQPPLMTPAMPSFNIVEPPQAPRKASASSSRSREDVAENSEELTCSNALRLEGVAPISPTPYGAEASAIELDDSPTVEQATGPKSTQLNSSPMTDAGSTPGTIFSSLFDGRSAGPGSEISRGTSVAEERRSTGMKLLEHGGGVPMSRGNTAPVDQAIDEVDEETTAEMKKRHPVNQGLSRSETADWIRSQSVALHSEPRERQGTATSYETASSAAEVQQMVLSTSSSSSQENKVSAPFLPRLPESTLTRKGPWPKSPLLLQHPALADSESVSPVDEGLQQSESGIGLGLFFSEQEVAQGDRKLDSVPTVGEARRESGTLDPLPSVAEQEQPSVAVHHVQLAAENATFAQKQVLPSGSISSSIDGFACNVTPSLPQGLSQQAAEASSSSRFGSKLWKVVVEGQGKDRKSSLSMAETPLTPPIRQLTLVKRNEAEVFRSQRASSARRQSMDLSKLAAAKAAVDAHLETVRAPSTAPIPDAPTFPTTAAVPVAFEKSRRSAKHVRRVSRLQYITDNRKEVRLDIPGSEDDQLAELKSPRPAPSPSGETPDMLYGNARSRHSWGLLPHARAAATPVEQQQGGPRVSSPVSPLLDFYDDGRGLRATQERAELLEKTSTNPSHRTTASLDGDHAASLLRRRSGLERPSMTSPSPTAVIRPFSLRSGINKRASLQAEIASRDGVKLAQVEEEEHEMSLRRLRNMGDQLPEQENATRMSVFVPLTTLQAHLRNKRIANLQARAGIEPTMRKNVRTAAHEPRPMIVAGSNLQYSAGKLLDVDQPARALFFAGFLCMPWLWLIGGWWLAKDGSMLTPGAERVEFWRHQPSMEAAQKKAHEQEKSPPTKDEERFARVPSPEPELIEAGPAAATSGTFSYLSLQSARSQPTHDTHRSHPHPPRVLLQGDPAKLPKKGRRSVRGALQPNPEVALFQSPVRTSAIPTNAYASSVEDLASTVGRSTRRPFASSRLASDLELEDSEQDDSGVELSHFEDSRHEPNEAEEEPPIAATPKHSSLYLSSQRRAVYRGSMLFDVVDGSVLQANETNFMQRITATEKYVLMNRFMAVVATLSAFAGMGIALNAVATGF